VRCVGIEIDEVTKNLGHQFAEVGHRSRVPQLRLDRRQRPKARLRPLLPRTPDRAQHQAAVCRSGRAIPAYADLQVPQLPGPRQT
jgi:hypothetical protein